MEKKILGFRNMQEKTEDFLYYAGTVWSDQFKQKVYLKIYFFNFHEIQVFHASSEKISSQCGVSIVSVRLAVKQKVLVICHFIASFDL